MRGPGTRFVRWLEVGVWVVALMYTAGLGSLIRQRCSYPFDLEWMEGGVLVHAWRLVHGLPMYPEPGPEFVPFIYPPGFASVIASLSYVFTMGAPLGRAVSIVATAAACGAVLHAVRRSGASASVAGLAALTFLVGYRTSGAFYDLVRIDALCVAFVAWSVALVVDGRRGTSVAAGLALAAAFSVKQNVAVFGVPLVAALALRDGWRTAAAFVLASAGPALGLTAFLEFVSEGRYLRYLLDVPASHGLAAERAFPGAPVEIVAAYPATVMLCLAWGVARLAQVRGTFLRPSLVLHAGVVGFGLVSAVLMRAHHGGFLNVHMPMFWCLSWITGVVLARIRGGWARGTALTLVAAQFVWAGTRLDATRLIPTEADVATGWAVVERLRGAEPPVWVPHAPWLAVLAGHEPAFHVMGLWDLGHDAAAPFPYAEQPIRAAIGARRWGTIVEGRKSLGLGVREHYIAGEVLPIPNGQFRPRTGWQAVPSQLWHRTAPEAR